MQALEFSIVSKQRLPSSSPAKLSDFELVEAGSIPARRLIDDPTISLYCLDDEHKQFIFVQTPSHADVYSYPFLYLAQYDLAQKLYALPYDKAEA